MKRIILSLFLVITFFTMAYSQYAESFFTSNPNYKQELERSGATALAIPMTVNYKPLGTISWSEGFEGTTFPPTGWAVHQLDGGVYTWVRYTTTPIFGAASAAVQWESTTLRNNDWLVTPQFMVNPGAFLNFYAKRQSTSYFDSVEIYYSTAGGVPPSGYTYMTTIMPAGTTGQLFQIPLGALAGQNVFIAFRYKELDEWRFYLDSVYVETPVAIDAGVSAINRPTTFETTVGTAPQIVVRNFGANPTGPFQATLTISPGGYNQVVSVPSLASGGTATLDFPSWTPSTKGTYQVVAYVSLPGDLNPQNDTLKRTVVVTEELVRDFVHNLTTLNPGGIALYGVEYTGTHFFVTKWNENKIFRINTSATVIDSFVISGLATTSGLRDLAWDGQYLYGSNATTTVFRLDISTFTVTTAFTSPITVRGIAYDKDKDAFWVSNWNTDIRLVSRTGATLQTITAASHGLTGMSGLAYDTLTTGGPFIWALNGGSADAEKVLYKIRASNGAKVDSFKITHHLPAGAIGGGVFVTDKLVTGMVTLGVLNQGTPHLISGYRIGGAALPPSLTVVHPNGNEVFNTESKEIIVWKSENYTGNIDIFVSLDGGLNWNPIATNIPNTGFYSVTTPTTTTTNGLIKVQATGAPTVFDVSDAPFSIVSATNPQVHFPLVVTDQVFAQSLRMGLDPTATDGIDPALGEYELPPIPPATVFDSRLIGSEIGIPQLGNGTYKDFRQGSNTFSGQRIHAIRYQISQLARNSSKPITIYWDLPTNVTGRLQDFVTGSIIDIQMTGTGSYTVTNPSLYDKLKITYTYTFTPPVTGEIKVLYPNGGELLRKGSNVVVAWRSNVPGKIRLLGSTDAGANWILIADSLDNTGVFGSNIGFDTFEGNQWKIRIQSIANPSIFDESDGTFTIQGTKLVLMDNPFVISDGNSSVGLFYGIDPTATDGLDPALNEAELPPPPPTGVFDGRFVGTDIGIPQLGQGTLKDYRQGGSTFSGNKIHQIQYQMGSGDSLRLFWYLPSNVTGLIQDFVTGTIVNVPMSGAGRYTVPNPSILNKLKITLTYTGIAVSIQVVQPNGGENWTVGSTKQIIWNAQNVQNVRLEYSTNNGATWILIANNVPALTSKISNKDAEQLDIPTEGTLGTYNWVIPNTPSNQCLVKVTDVTNPSIFDVSDNVFTISTIPPGPQLQFNYDISALSPGNYSLYGSEFDGQYFYITRWNEPKIFRVNKAGTQIDSFTVTGLPTGGFRDLAFDGQYLYGSNNTTTVYRIDRTTFAATAHFTSPIAVRAIAFDAARNAFWISNWSTDIVLVSRTGATLYTIPATQHRFTGMAGNAYDTLSAGGPYLWIFSGGTATDPKILYKISPVNGQRLDSIVVTDILAPGAIGGGLWVSDQYEPMTVTLGGSSQGVPHRLFGYRIHPVGPPLPSIQVVQPNGGENWAVGSTQNIIWNASNVSQVRLEYTTNNGATWILIANNVPAVTTNKVRLDGYSPKDPNGVIEGQLGMYSWVIPNTPSSQCKVRVTDVSNPAIFDESDNTFTITAAAIGESWTVQSSGTSATLYSVSTVNENVAWATGAGGVVIRTTNGGTTWTTVTTPRAVDAHVICGISATRALVATNGATDAVIHLTTNGGVSWQNVFTQAGGFINVIIMFDELNGFAQGDPVGTTWTLLRTTNGGLTWTSAATLPPVGGEYGWNNSGWNIGDIIWFGTNSSRVYKSTNRGTTWTSAPTTVVNGYAIAFGNELKGLLGSATGTANRSTDGGSSWASITTPATGHILGITAHGENEYWFTSNNIVYYTGNHGTSWSTSFTAGQTLNHIHFKSLGGLNAVGYVVGNSGYVAKYYRGPITPQITVVSPNGGENWTVGSTRQIVWNAQAIQQVRLEYSTNNGATWILIANNVPALTSKISNKDAEQLDIPTEGTLGTYNWVIPNTPSNQCLVKVTDVGNPAIFDVSDNVFTISTAVPGPQLQFNYDISALSPGNYSLYGSEFDGQYFYITRWNEPKIFRVNKAGTHIDSFTVTGLPTGGFRDLAFDGQYLYGSNNTTTVYRIDRTTFAATAHFTSPIAVRAIAFDAARNAFWISNWSTDIVLVSRTGATLYTIPATQHRFTGMAGNAYDTLSAGGPYLWIFSGGTTTDPKILYKISPVNGQRLDSIIVTDILAPGAIGGGLWVSDQYEPMTVTLGGSSQGVPHRLFGYKIHEYGPVPGTVTVLSPNGGEKYYRGTWQLITWKSFEFDARVKIKITSDGVYYSELGNNIPNTGVFAYRIPLNATIANTYKIRIESQTDPSKFDESDGTFEIADAPYTLPVVDLPMVVSDNEKSRLLRFGLDPAATDGIDPQFGEEELPPVPPAGILDGRFIGDDIGLQLGQGLALDYRKGRATAPSIKIHELKFQRGTGNLIVINLYLPDDVSARFETFTAGFDTTVRGVARLVITDTLISKLKITINYFPSAVLGTFNLVGPFNNQLIGVKQNDSTIVTFRWNRSRNAIAYRLRMGVPTIPPFMLDRPSNNNGTDSVFTIRQFELFNIFSKPEHPIDTTITGQWAVWAYDANDDSLRSANVFTIRLRLIKVTSVDDEIAGIPNKFVVYQNYPNPFNPSTKIKFGLPEDANVTIEVFNVVGEKVATLVSGNLRKGYHEISFDAAGLNSGVYFYKVNAGNYSTIKKMMLIK